MQNNQEQIIGQVREYMFYKAPVKLDLSDLADELQISLNEMVEVFPSPDILIEKMLRFEKRSFEHALDQYDFASQSAIDNFIVVGQEVYNRYKDVHPCIFARLQSYSPLFSEERFVDLLQQIFDLFITNINSGLREGVFAGEIDFKLPINEFIKRIVAQENEMICKNQRFITFGILFNNYFEEFLQNSITSEAWRYFITRKRFVESLDFGR